MLASQRPAAKSLLDWYDRHRRVLPWRALPGQSPDPYAVWLSEIMLQQTTVQAVKAYYERFLARWPRVPSRSWPSPDEPRLGLTPR
jgi:A/G-specific adenine glycosylase